MKPKQEKEQIILKPSWNRLKQASHPNSKASKLIILPTGNGYYFKDPQQIIRLNSNANYCMVELENGENIFVAKTLKYLQQQLPPENFLRIHNSHLVNIEYISFYSTKESQVLLNNGEIIPVSKSGKKILTNWMKFL
jgi:two-component system LytT family response regulator